MKCYWRNFAQQPFAIIAVLAVVLALGILPAADANAQSDEPSVEDVVKQAEEIMPERDDTLSVVKVEMAMAERTLGDPNAPVTMLEYASMTCHHCADFHSKKFATIKEEYIDTGKVYYILRDFPLDAAALKAAMMARCVAPENYFNVVEVVFSTQSKWADDPGKILPRLGNIGRLAGLSAEDFDACVRSEDLSSQILLNMQKGQSRWGVRGTPYFIFNNGDEQFSGSEDLDVYRQTIDKLLAQ